MDKGLVMKMKFTQREIRQVFLACGLMLMLGWFTLYSSYLWQDYTVSQNILQEKKQVPVLMYHHLVPQAEVYGIFADNNIVITVEKFREQMTCLKEQGYQTISLAQLQRFLAGEEELPQKSIVLTFDDGYLSNYKYAYPILQELGYHGVIFLLTSVVEEQPQQYTARGVQYLSWQEIAQMGDVFEFGCHTDHLHKLTLSGKGILTAASPTEVAADLELARQKMGEVSYYCYPYGHYTERTIETLEREGVKLAFTIGAEHVKRGDDPLRLKCWDMYQYELQEVLETIQ